MFNYFKNIISSEYDRDPSFIRLVRIVLAVATITMVALFIFTSTAGGGFAISSVAAVLMTLAILTGAAFFLTYRKILWPGKVLVPLAALIGIVFMSITGHGLRDSAAFGFAAIIVGAGMLIGQRAIPLATFLALIGVWIIAAADMTGLTKSDMAKVTDFDTIAVVSLIQVFIGASLNGLMNRLNAALEASRANEKAQIEASRELQKLQAGLEQRVAARTRDLATVTEISRHLSATASAHQLAVDVVERLQEAFHYYHAHIYFLDEITGDLVMAGGTGEAGAQMLARGHKVQKGHGLVGRAAKVNAPVLVPDVSKEADWLPNPLLPETRSEAAIPIASGDRMLGVLDVQQNMVNSLGEEDVDLLQSIASQVAVSLQNVRALEGSRSQAELETMVNLIGQKIQRTTSMEDALQTAIRELGLAVGASRVRAHVQANRQVDEGVSLS